MANTISLDFTGVESFSNIPEGTHNVVVSSADFKKAKTGSDQLEITFQTPDGATKMSWYNLQPQALWKVKGLLEALGIPCEGKINLNTRQIVGKTCQIVVEPDPNDTTRTIVTKAVKISVETGTVNYNQAPVAPMPQMAPPVMPQPQVAPTPVAPVPTPAPVPQAPVQPTAEQVFQPAGSPAGAPPWMTAQPTQAQPQAQPMGNKPPWMK